MSHLAAIGLSDTDALRRAADASSLRPGGGHRLWRDPSGAMVAFHLDGEAIDCLTPFYEASPPTTWRVRTVPVADGSCPHCSGVDCDVLDLDGELLTRTACQLLLAVPSADWLAEADIFDLEVVCFAHATEVYDDEADHATRTADTEPRFAPVSFIPMGMFDEGDDVTHRATVLISGTVEALDRPENALTGDVFTVLRIRTWQGPVTIVSEDVLLDARVGGIATVQGWLVGRPLALR